MAAELSLFVAILVFGLIVFALLRWSNGFHDEPVGEFRHRNVAIFVAIASYWGIDRLQLRRAETRTLVEPAARSSWSTTCVLVIAHMLGALVLVALVEGALELAYGRAMPESPWAERLTSGELNAVLLTALVVLVLAPVSEELLVRGLLFRRLMSISPTAAWLTSALVFGAWHLHVGLPWLPVFVAMALVFTHVYVRTGRLSAAIATHAGYNVLALTLPL